MNRTPTTPGDGSSRRSVLAACAAGLTLPISGCIDRAASTVDQSGNDRLALSITTVPADGNREIVRIARELETNLEAVGADVSIDMRSPTEFLETVLINHDFDLYVGRHPGDYDPDFLYEALHSTYANESGWQNPFGFTDLTLDSLLEDQRRVDGKQREERVRAVLQGVAEEKPFEPICIPEEHRVARSDRFTGWDEGSLATRHGYLGLKPASGVNRLHALVTDPRPSRNLNPISATLRERETTIDLLYDSLATEHDGTVKPWLAKSWDWSKTTGDSSQTEDVAATATVSLREGCTFHDGKPVTADDVKFTYRFLEDTSLGLAQSPSPAPQYQGHISMIDQITVTGDSQLQISVTASPEVAERAFTVPILPKHRWRSQVTSRAEGVGTFTAPQGQWGLVTMDNVPPVGSGPFRFKNRTERDHLTLERFEEHFTRRNDVDLPTARIKELQFSIDPGSASSVERVASGGADVTASMLEAYAIDSVPEKPELKQLTSPSQTFYHLGFNTRTEPFSNPHVRRLVSQLLDKSWLAKNVFRGYADPVATPLPPASKWIPDDLAWNGTDPVAPFLGTEGNLDADAAKAAFEEVGFRYDSQGRLLM